MVFLVVHQHHRKVHLLAKCLKAQQLSRLIRIDCFQYFTMTFNENGNLCSLVVKLVRFLWIWFAINCFLAPLVLKTFLISVGLIICSIWRWLRLSCKCCRSHNENSYHTVCIDNGDDFSDECSSQCCDGSSECTGGPAPGWQQYWHGTPCATVWF